MELRTNDIYNYSAFSLCVSVYVYASVCDFLCIALLLPFVIGFSLSIFFFYLKRIFFLNNIFLFFNLITLFYFILLYFILSSPSFILFFSLLF